MKTILISLIVAFAVFGAKAEIPSDLIFGGIPKTNGAIKDLQITILTNVAYVVGYDEKRKNPAWVAYKLVKTNNPFPSKPRPTRYPMDEKDFKGSDGRLRGKSAKLHDKGEVGARPHGRE